MKKVDKHFVSDITKFLEDFDKSHEKSLSQLKEIEKHQRIYNLRDRAVDSSMQQTKSNIDSFEDIKE